VLLAAMAGLFMVPSSDPALATIGLVMPMAGPGDLVARGWGAGVTEAALPAVPLGLTSTVLWLAVSGAGFHRAFRWEPRA
jgi:ABC-2 type transport system permease protein